MKFVGEVMAIDRRFEEALQKALRMIDEQPQSLVRWKTLHSFTDQSRSR
jgi:carbamoylphosphate synthase large subunit